LNYARAGRLEKAGEIATELKRRDVAALYPALAHWGLGEEDAFELFANGFEERVDFGWILGSVPGNERLGCNTRWTALLGGGRRRGGCQAGASQSDLKAAALIVKTLSSPDEVQPIGWP
jgi:hypothetical protein